MTPSSQFLQQRSEPYPHWSFTTATGDELRIVPERGGLVTGRPCIFTTCAPGSISTATT